MTTLRWVVGQAIGWIVVVCLGTFGFLALLYGVLGGGAGGVGTAVALTVGVGGSAGALVLSRRMTHRLDPNDPVARVLATLPRGAAVRRGRAWSIPWLGLAIGVFITGAVMAAVGVGFGVPIGEAVIVLVLASAIAGGLIGLADARRSVASAIARAISLPGILLGLLVLIAIADPEPDDPAELLGAGLLIAAVTVPPILAGMVLGRVMRGRFDDDPAAAKGAGLSAGLERALDQGRTAAVVWTYPYDESGERNLATDCRIVPTLGYEVVLEDRRPPTASVLDVLSVAGIGSPGDSGSIRVVYRRRAPVPGAPGPPEPRVAGV